MNRWTTGLSAIFITAVAIAATSNVTWVNATQNTDNTLIPATGPGSIASTTIEYGTCNGTAFGSKLGQIVVTGPLTSASMPSMQPGTWCARALHTNTYNASSDVSNVAVKVVAAPTPNAPSNFSWP